MFGKRPTKQDIRKQHDAKIQDFLAHGGKIQKVPPGATGLVDGRPNTRHISIHGRQDSYTPVPGVIAAIEARKSKKKPCPKSSNTTAHSYQRIILDDFGEPVRIVQVQK